MKRQTILIAFLILLCLSGYGQHNFRIIMHDFNMEAAATAVETELYGRKIPDMIRKGILDLQIDSITLLERNEMARMWKDKGRREEFPEIFDEETALKVGKVLEANYVIFGSITTWDNEQFDVSARIVDIETSAIIVEEAAVFERDLNPRYKMECLGVELMESLLESQFKFPDPVLKLVIACPVNESYLPDKSVYDGFGKNIQSTLLSKLSIVSNIEVFQREESIDLTCGKDVVDICGENGADAVVQTRYEVDEQNNLHLHLQLTEKCHGQIVSNAQISGSYDNRRDLASNVVFELLDIFHINLSKNEREEVTRPETQSNIAYDFFGEGLNAYDHGKYSYAITLFEDALKQDSTYSKARFYLGKSYFMLGEYERAEAEITASLDNLGEFNEQIWRHEVAEETNTPPVSAENMLIYGSSNGLLIGLDIASGNIVWEYYLNRSVDAMKVMDGLLVIHTGGSPDTLAFLDIQRKQPLKELVVRGGIDELLSAGRGRVFMNGQDDHMLYIADFPSGRIDSVRCDGELVSSYLATVIYRNDTVIYLYGDKSAGPPTRGMHSDPKGFVACFDLKNHTALWKTTLPASVYGGMLLHDSTLYIGAYDGYLYALNGETGSILWDFSTYNSIFTTPVVHDSTLYLVSDDHYLYALSFDGNLKWKRNTNGIIEYMPLVNDDMVMVMTDRNTLFAYDHITGTLQWKKQLDHVINPNFRVVFSGNRLIMPVCEDEMVLSAMLGIYCIDIEIMNTRRYAEDRNSNAYLELGILQYETGRYGEAIRNLSHCLSIDENKKEAYRYLALSYEAMEQPFHAVENWKHYASYITQVDTLNHIRDKISKAIDLRWETDIAGEIEFIYFPVIYDEYLFIGTFDDLYKIDLTTGDITDSYKIPDFRSYYALDGSVIYYANSMGEICAYDMERSLTQWKFDTRVTKQYLRPMLSRGKLYVFAETDAVVEAVFRGHEMPVTRINNLYHSADQNVLLWALDPATGDILWKAERPGAVGNLTLSGDAQTGYAGSYDQAELRAIDLATGKVLWKQNTGNMLKAKPVVQPHVVYTAGSPSANEMPASVKDYPELASLYAMLNQSGHIINESYNLIQAFRKTDGKELWNFPVIGWSLIEPVYDEEILIVNVTDNRNFGTLYGIDPASGMLQWMHHMPEEIRCRPLLYNNILLVPLSNGQVFTLNKNSGRLLEWYYDVQAEIQTAPVIDAAREQLIIVSNDGVVHTFALPALPDKKEDIAYRTACRNMAKGKSRAAIKTFGEIVGADSTFANCYIQLGSIYAGKSMPEQAAANFELAKQYYPEANYLDWKLAEVYFRAGNYASAQKLLERNLQIDNSDDQLLMSPVYALLLKTYLRNQEEVKAMDLYLAREDILFQRADYDGLIRELSDLTDEPMEDQLRITNHVLLAIAYFYYLEDDKLARHHSREAIAIIEGPGKGKPDYESWLPFIYQTMGQPEMVVSVYNDLIANYPDKPEFRRELADFYLKYEYWDLALTEYMALRDHDSIYLYREIIKPAIDLYLRGAYEDALASLYAATELYPENDLYKLTAGHCFIELGEYEAGLILFELSDPEDPAFCSFYPVKAVACDELGDHSEAISSYRAAIDCSEEKASPCNSLAYFFAEHDTCLQEALELVNTSIETDSSMHYASLDTRGWIYYKLGQTETARRDILNAIYQTPKSPQYNTVLRESYYHLGEVFIRLERPEDARAAFENALLCDPYYEPPRQALHAYGMISDF